MSTLFIFLSSVMISAFLTSIESQKCKHPLPNFIMKTASGIDMTKLDSLPIPGSSNSDSDGFVENVFNFTCNGNNKWHDPYDTNDSTEYDVPDEFRLHEIGNDDPRNWEYYSIDHNLLDAKEQRARRIHPFNYRYIDIIEKLFTQNPKFQSLLKQHFDEGKIFAEISMGTEVVRVEMSDDEFGWMNRTLSQDFVEFTTEKLPPKYEDNPAIYQQFVQRFGTHIFSSGYYGFAYYLQVAISPQYALQYSDEQMLRNAKVMFYRMFNMSYFHDDEDILWGEDKSTCQVEEEFVKHSEVVLAYGGSKMAKWVDKVSGKTLTAADKLDRVLLFAEFKELSTLIQNKTIRAQVQIAVKMYMIKAYLGELKNLYSYINYQIPESEKTSIVQVEMILNSNDFRNMDKIDEMIDDLYNHVSGFQDRKFCHPTLYDIYVTSNLKMDFAEQICNRSMLDDYTGYRKRLCASEHVVQGANDVNELFNSYENGALGSDCVRRVRDLNVQYHILRDRDNGLGASCIFCPWQIV